MRTARFASGGLPAKIGLVLMAGSVLICPNDFAINAHQLKAAPAYNVLSPVTQANLAVFPVVTNAIHDTHIFLTLDQGLRSGQVIVTETGASSGFVRPHPTTPVWRDRVYPGSGIGAQVNRLMLVNNSDRPLLLLAGEIVTGGKQDRIVGKDRIIPAKSDPIDLSVFCVEPHRWTARSAHFGNLDFAMAQPSIRLKAMADKNQGAVWNEVAKSRARIAAATPLAATQIESTSSYAGAMDNSFVQRRLDEIATPIEHSYEGLIKQLRARNAVGAVVAVNGHIVWSDIFASPSLFEKYWPKLVRSYAAEAVDVSWSTSKWPSAPSTADAQAFIGEFTAGRQSVESEPGVYRQTEIMGTDFDAFVLTSLLPGTGFDVHVAKMRD